MKGDTSRWQGFTLIEVAITLCLVGILSAIAYPGYQAIRGKVRRTEAHIALLHVMQQQERYHTQYNTYQPFSAGEDEKRFKWYSGEEPSRSAYQIHASSCGDGSLHHCVMLSAIPGGPYVDQSFHDPFCGTLILNSDGEKSAAGKSAEDTPSGCW